MEIRNINIFWKLPNFMGVYVYCAHVHTCLHTRRGIWRTWGLLLLYSLLYLPETGSLIEPGAHWFLAALSGQQVSGPSYFNSGATGAAAIPNNSVDAEEPNKDPHNMQQTRLPTEPFSRPDCKHILTSTQDEPCPLLVKNWLLLVSGCSSLVVVAFYC